MAFRLNKLKMEICELEQDKAGKYFVKDLNTSDRVATSVGHRIYIPCKADLASSQVPCMVVIDRTTNLWKCENIFGPARSAGRCCLYEDKILWLGLKNYAGEQGRNGFALSTYDMAMEEWSHFPTAGNPPFGRYGFSWQFVQESNKMVLFGGKLGLGVSLNDVHLLDPEAKRWIQPVVKGEPPKNRGFCGTCTHNGVFYCYGGIEMHQYSDGIFLLSFSPGNVVTWSKPKFILGELARFQLSSFALVPFEGVLVFCAHLGRSDSGLRVYDPKTGNVSKLYAETSKNFTGYASVVTAFPLEHEAAVVVLGGTTNCRHYLRISRSD